MLIIINMMKSTSIIPNKVLNFILVEPIIESGNPNNVLGLDGKPIFVDTTWDNNKMEVTEGRVVRAPKKVPVDLMKYLSLERTTEDPISITNKYKKGFKLFFDMAELGLEEGDIIGFHKNQLPKRRDLEARGAP